MNEILVFRHIAHEGPGYLGDFLTRCGLKYRLVRIDEGEPVPKSLVGIQAFVFMGGPMSVNDPLPWIPDVLSLIRQAERAGMPVLGHCLGGQLIAKALGGVITRNPVKEIGWMPVTRVDCADAHSWMEKLPLEFEAYHWHGETFSIPPGASRILASRHCANQAFVLGKTLAFQCHIEMTADMIREWTRIGEAEIAQARRTSPTVQSESEQCADLDTRVARLQGIADIFYDRWTRGLET
jgi:GMP synthase-like glutamine amidotransferase